MDVALAGHPAPLRLDTGEPAEVERRGPPLGVALDIQPSRTTLTLAPGEGLLLYTDGITEARVSPGSQERLGEEGLRDALVAGAGRDTTATARRAAAGHARHRGRHAVRRRLPGRPPSMRLTVLGSGSPRPDPQRSQPAALLTIGGEHVLVDCGDGTMRRLVEAGVDAASVTRVVLTHLHWDHVLGLPAFAWGSWGLGRRRLEVWGPAGAADLLRTTLQAPFAEQAAWVATLGWDPAGWDDVDGPRGRPTARRSTSAAGA